MNRFESILTSSVAGKLLAAVGDGGLFQAVPGLAAVFGAKSVAEPVVSGDCSRGDLTTRINDSDIAI